MTSLLTNTSAMVALRTLNDINSDLDATNARVSTGLRVANAQDSAAYWSIATTTESDNAALGAVKDAIGLGAATMDVTYNGLEATRSSLQDMKNLLISARQPGVDRAAIQKQISGIITDITNKASASVINKQNYLAVKTDATGYNASKAIVASFARSASGVSIQTISLTISTIAVTDANATASAKTGIIDKDRTANATTIKVNAIDISALTDSAADLTTLENYINIVDTAVTDTISAQTLVGTVQARAESQKGFVSALMDANKTAVGALVDADMEAESTKLRALQTQQQLAIQSLSISNSSSQNVLQLFR
jgi:flagellin